MPLHVTAELIRARFAALHNRPAHVANAELIARPLAPVMPKIHKWIVAPVATPEPALPADFIPEPFEPFAPLFTPAELAEADATARSELAFEAAVAALPLRLTA